MMNEVKQRERREKFRSMVLAYDGADESMWWALMDALDELEDDLQGRIYDIATKR